MRVVVLGGTRFIGRAASEALIERGHELMLVHRGESEPETLRATRHLHVARAGLAAAAGAIRDFDPDAVVDTYALTRADAQAALAVIPEAARTVVLSSCDVYRAYESRDAGLVTDEVPLTESSPLRDRRYPYRGRYAGLDDYEKLDVEELYRRRGAAILRLGFVYGPHDGQRREEFILRRIRAGRPHIPCGPGNWLLSRCYVVDAARAIVAAIESPQVARGAFNIAEAGGVTVRLWAQQILDAAGASADFVRVSAALLPGDMAMTAMIQQHMLIDSSRARELLGWAPSPAVDSVRASVAWHLAHPPEDADVDFRTDDIALAAAAQ